jgi:protease I
VSTPGDSGARRALVLVAAGYRDLEFWYPVLRLREAGLEVEIRASSAEDTLRSELGYPVIADGEMKGVDGAAYDVVVVPGGAAGKALASDADAVALLKSVAAGGGRVVTIGSGRAATEAAGVAGSGYDDADGLPPAMRELLAGLET